MPRGDGTGPAGMGPMTGRAAGYCAGYDVPGYMNPYGARPAWGGSFPYPTYRGMAGYPYPAGPYNWSGTPAYGPFLSRGRGGFGRGRGGFGRGRGRW
jgi:hypothetical protein